MLVRVHRRNQIQTNMMRINEGGCFEIILRDIFEENESRTQSTSPGEHVKHK